MGVARPIRFVRFGTFQLVETESKSGCPISWRPQERNSFRFAGFQREPFRGI